MRTHAHVCLHVCIHSIRTTYVFCYSFSFYRSNTIPPRLAAHVFRGPTLCLSLGIENGKMKNIHSTCADSLFWLLRPGWQADNGTKKIEGERERETRAHWVIRSQLLQPTVLTVLCPALPESALRAFCIDWVVFSPQSFSHILNLIQHILRSCFYGTLNQLEIFAKTFFFRLQSVWGPLAQVQQLPEWQPGNNSINGQWKQIQQFSNLKWYAALRKTSAN